MEHAPADKWMANMAYETLQECEQLVHMNPGGWKLECEVWHVASNKADVWVQGM